MEFVISEKKGPIFRQIADYIVKLIAIGELSPGGKLPSTRDLAVTLNVNPNTVVAAYKYLETENIAETKRGLGTFVMESISIEVLKRNVLKEYAEAYMREFVAIGIELQQGLSILEEVYNEYKG